MVDTCLLLATSDAAIDPQEFQGDGIRAEGVLYPSPASRFGARDNRSSKYSTSPISAIGDDIAMGLSPHFARRAETRKTYHCDDWNASHQAHKMFHTGNLYCDHLDRRCHLSYRESPQPRRLALGGRFAGAQSGDNISDSDDEPLVPEADEYSTRVSTSWRRSWMSTSDVDTRIEYQISNEQTQNDCKYHTGQAGVWAAEAPGVRSETILPPPKYLDFRPTDDLPHTDRKESEKEVKAIDGCHRQGNGSVDPSIVLRNEELAGNWLQYLPGVAEEKCSKERGEGVVSSAERENRSGLSRLFDYAFTDKSRYQGLREPGEKSDIPRGGKINYSGHAAQICSERSGGALRGDRNYSGHSQSSSPRRSRCTINDEKGKQALVGVTVRRPQSPQFSFMDKGSPRGALGHCPSRKRSLPEAKQGEVEEMKTAGVDRGISRVNREEQLLDPRKCCDNTEEPGKGNTIPTTRMPAVDMSACQNKKCFPRSGPSRAMSSPRDEAECTPPRVTKGKRSEALAELEVLVPVRRPPSPHLSFMGEDDSRDTPEQCSPKERKRLEETATMNINHDIHRVKNAGQSLKSRKEAATINVNHGIHVVENVGQSLKSRKCSNNIKQRSDSKGGLPKQIPAVNMTPCRKEERCPWSESDQAISSPRGEAACTHPRRSKRGRPEALVETVASVPRGSPSPPTAGRRPVEKNYNYHEDIQRQQSPEGSSDGRFLEEEGTGLGGGWLGWTRACRRVRHGWWGAGGSATSAVNDYSSDDIILRSTVEWLSVPYDPNAKDTLVEDTAGAGAKTRGPQYGKSAAKVRSFIKTLRPAVVDEARKWNISSDVKVNGWVGDDRLPRLDAGSLVAEKGVGNILGIDKTLVVGNFIGAKGNNRCNSSGSHREKAGSTADAENPPTTPVRVLVADAALAYDRDVLGGDGVTDVTGCSEQEACTSFLGDFLPSEACDRCDRVRKLVWC